MKYLVVIEKGESSWGVYVPDLPGCVAAASSREKVVKLIRETTDFHLAGMRDHGEALPEPTSESELIEVGVA